MKKHYLLSIILFVAINQVFGQEIVRFYPEVNVGSTQLRSPWEGGINNPQISQLDIDNDQKPEMVIFDKSSSSILFYKKMGVSDTAWRRIHPKIKLPLLMDWAIFKDYNNDGIIDIFTSSFYRGVSGVDVFTGYISQDSIRFRSFQFGRTTWNVIPIPTSGASGWTQLYITNFDIPAIEDTDKDGDLDILTFSPSGGYLELYKNNTVEFGYGLDSLVFSLYDPCWGKFYETGINKSLKLSTLGGICPSPFDDGLLEKRHIGSTVTAFDADKDNDIDVILGDISFTTLVHLTNTGTLQNAHCTIQDTLFPHYDIPAEIKEFPVGFAVDINLDGQKDILVAPNELYFITDFGNRLWYYQKDTASQRFHLKQKNFLGSEMLDFGTSAAPCLVDINGDNLKDLIVGNAGQFDENENFSVRLYLFLNTGTANIPKFTLVDSNYLNMARFTGQLSELVPAVGDIDRDGDIDMLIGNSEGYLMLVENISSNQQFIPSEIVDKYMGIYVGRNASPMIFDANGDGKMDIIVGEKNGNINYFQNIGAANAPMYNSNPSISPNTEAWGNINARDLYYGGGYGQCILVSFADKKCVLLGNESGQMRLLEINSNTFINRTDQIANLPWEGEKLKITAGDLDGDGKLELICGNTRGGIACYKTPFIPLPSVSVKNNISPEIEMVLSPNPANEIINIQLSNTEFRVPFCIYNGLGEEVSSGFFNGNYNQINTANLLSGIYFLKIRGNQKTKIAKFCIQH